MKKFSLLGLMVLSVCVVGMAGADNLQSNTVIVPNVEGITLEVAVKILQTVGLQAQLQSTNLAALVVQQDPRPGITLPVGGAVLLATGALTTPIQQPTGTRALQSLPPNPPQTRNATTGVSPTSGTCQGCSNRSLKVTVIPSQPTSQENRGLTAPTQLPRGQTQLFAQPSPQAANPHLVVNTTSRVYPAWYPRRFIAAGNTPTTVPQPQIQNVRIPVQSQNRGIPVQSQAVQPIPVTPNYIQKTAPQAYLTWYPKVFASQGSGQFQVYGGQLESPRVGVWAVAPTPAVPVPNLLRLYQNDAVAALARAGLSMGNIIRVQSPQVGSGLVIRQSLAPRALVPAGTPVDLWVAN